jgi:predicted nucleic acid-binding protein
MGLQKDAPWPLLNVIVDTCVWSRFLRRNRLPADSVVAEVARLVRADVVELMGPIRQELLSGAQPDERFEQLRDYLRFYPNLPLDEADDELAASYYNLCRQRGLQCTGTDLLICAAAVRRGLKIFTTDSDFDSFAKHLPIKLHRVAK